MLLLQLNETKDVMNKLLLSDVFDRFSLVEASVITFRTVVIDGHLQKSFYSAEELSKSGLEDSSYSPWSFNRPLLVSCMKGNTTPLQFKIILALSRTFFPDVLKDCGTAFTQADVNSLLLNLKFDGTKIVCTTGTSLHIFSTDKSINTCWDSYIQNFLKENNIISTHVE